MKRWVSNLLPEFALLDLAGAKHPKNRVFQKALTYVVAGLITGTVGLTVAPLAGLAQATAPAEDLFYTFYGQAIPLTLQPDVIAVQFRETGGTRTGQQPAYLRLQQALQGGGTRSGDRPRTVPVEVNPLGDRYALVTIPAGTRSPMDWEQEIRQQSYVTATLPVLRLAEASEEESTVVVLPNEIIVSFDPDLSNSQIQLLLNRYQLEVIRPLQFTRHRYLVRSRQESGTAILSVANRLNGVTGIQSATPNFIQSLHYQVQQDISMDASLATLPDASSQLQQLLASLPTPEAPYPSDLLALSWHLNSTPRRGILLPRTDVRATEAWEISNGGEGTVVAVIDSLLQWDHPGLIENVHMLEGQTDPLPGEVHGWDFTGNSLTCSEGDPSVCVPGDPDTRLSEAEIDILRPHFQNTFRLSSLELMETYQQLANWVQSNNPQLSEAETATLIRNLIRNDIAAEFHGTWSAGVIAASAPHGEGSLGVAPRAEILPVRVFGLGGEITTARLIEAIGYAADRGANVINMSLGGEIIDTRTGQPLAQSSDLSHPYYWAPFILIGNGL